MASTALSCVLWWRWFGILVMFHGMDRHSGIRTDSQDAARTAAGHRAQDTASRDTESPGDSMTVVGSQRGHCRCSGEGSVTHGELNPKKDVIFLLIGALLLLLLLLSGLRAARGSGRSCFIQAFTSSSSSIPPSLRLPSSAPFTSPLLLLSSSLPLLLISYPPC